MNFKISSLLLALVLTTHLGFGFNETDTIDVDIFFFQKIPTRDGILLSATVYKPNDQKEALPAIMGLTPYTFDSYHEDGMFLARNGYIFVSVDVRTVTIKLHHSKEYPSSIRLPIKRY